MSRFRIYVRDKIDIVSAEMPLLGEIDTYTDFQAINRHNAVGSWSLKMPAGIEQTSLLAPGRGIVVFRDNEQNFPVFSGPIRRIDRSWSKDEAGAGTLSVSGVCDNAILRERIGRVTPWEDWPYEGHTQNKVTDGGDAPKQSWDAFVFDPQPTKRDPANSGEFIYALLVQNYTIRAFHGDWDQSRICLPLSLDDIPSASLRALPDDDAWKGFPINMANLETSVFALAEAAGLKVSFQWQTKSKTDPTHTDTNKLFLNITPIADKSGSVVFDPSAGNITSYTLSSVAPDATRVILGGQVTEGGRRWYSLRKNDFFDPAGWTDRDDRDGFGNRLSPTSDAPWGRQKIEVDWNTNAEMFLDARDINWEFQIGTNDDPIASISPRPGTDVALQVDQEATKALVENGPTGLLTMTAVDSPACTFGVDYFVSDIVRVLLDNSFLPESMRPEDGIIREMVREVTLASTASAIWTIQPTIGTSDSSPTPYIYKQLKKLRSKVESVASTTVVDPLSSSRPNEPSLQISPDSTITTTDPDHSLYCITERPRPNQKYQVLVGELGGETDPGWITNDNAEVLLEYKNGEDGNWIRVNNVKPAPLSPPDNGWWYADITMTGTVGDVQYVRARFSRSGSVSDWGKPTLKLTAASGPIDTAGALTLNTPGGVHHPNAMFNLTGLDTTRAQLWLQIANPVGSAYVTQFTAPTFSGSIGEIYSIEHQVPDHVGSYNVRVVSTQQMGFGKGFGTIYKTSNVVTINVV